MERMAILHLPDIQCPWTCKTCSVNIIDLVQSSCDSLSLPSLSKTDLKDFWCTDQAGKSRGDSCCKDPSCDQWTKSWHHLHHLKGGRGGKGRERGKKWGKGGRVEREGKRKKRRRRRGEEGGGGRRRGKEGGGGEGRVGEERRREGEDEGGGGGREEVGNI